MSGLILALTVLWSRFHKFDAADPRWPDRDRFVLSDASATHLLYALLHLTGHIGIESSVLGTLRGSGEPPCWPAEYGDYPAIEASAAPGGQTIAVATGMAIAERIMAARFGKSLVDHRVWVAVSASELDEGVTHEAVSLAGQLRLDRLALLVDATAPEIEDARSRFTACGWAARAVDAEDCDEIEGALSFALRSRKPTIVWCTSGAAPVQEPDVSLMPDGWHRVSARGWSARRAWLKRFARHPLRPDFERAVGLKLPDSGHDLVTALRHQLEITGAAMSPAEACRQAVDQLVAGVPEISCLHVDDPRSRRRRRVELSQIAGRSVSFGNRSSCMVAGANGIALHDGVTPIVAIPWSSVAGTLPSLRLAATQRLRVVLLAFDCDDARLGSVWHPADLLGSLRAIDHLHVLRPASAMEAAECLELALRRNDGPSILVLSTEALAQQCTSIAGNRCARGGYVLTEADGPRRATLIASGADLGRASAVRDILLAHGHAVAVVSLPCWELFDAQSQEYQHAVLGAVTRVGFERASPIGWSRHLGNGDLFIACHRQGDGEIAMEVRGIID